MALPFLAIALGQTSSEAPAPPRDGDAPSTRLIAVDRAHNAVNDDTINGPWGAMFPWPYWWTATPPNASSSAQSATFLSSAKNSSAPMLTLAFPTATTNGTNGFPMPNQGLFPPFALLMQPFMPPPSALPPTVDGAMSLMAGVADRTHDGGINAVNGENTESNKVPWPWLWYPSSGSTASSATAMSNAMSYGHANNNHQVIVKSNMTAADFGLSNKTAPTSVSLSETSTSGYPNMNWAGNPFPYYNAGHPWYPQNFNGGVTDLALPKFGIPYFPFAPAAVSGSPATPMPADSQYMKTPWSFYGWYWGPPHSTNTSTQQQTAQQDAATTTAADTATPTVGWGEPTQGRQQLERAQQELDALLPSDSDDEASEPGNKDEELLVSQQPRKHRRHSKRHHDTYHVAKLLAFTDKQGPAAAAAEAANSTSEAANATADSEAANATLLAFMQFTEKQAPTAANSTSEAANATAADSESVTSTSEAANTASDSEAANATSESGEAANSTALHSEQISRLLAFTNKEEPAAANSTANATSESGEAANSTNA